MKTIKFRLYVLEISFVLSLFFALFALNNERRYIVLGLLILFTILSTLLTKRRKNKSIYEKHVSLLMLIISIIYLSGFYLLGLYYGFVKSKYPLSISNMIKIIIPTIIIIVLSEILRNDFLSLNGIIKIRGRKINFSSLLVFIAMVLIDLVIYAGAYSLSSLDDFLTIIGYILFSSLSSNLLYIYMSKNFGKKPIIIFRLFTSLYLYLIPYVPDVYLFLQTFLRMIIPYVIYIILERTYFRSFYKERNRNTLFSVITITALVLMIMLVSCQFKFGAMVIGSESMTGSINKGDAIIYERFDGGTIDVNQVILFNYNDIKTVHRIVDRSYINKEMRYITKGDYNPKEDDGYRVNEDITGVVKLRIKYIGYLTLWFRSLFG